MLSLLATVCIVIAALLALAATWYAIRDRLIDDLLLVPAGGLVIALVVQAVLASASTGRIDDTGEQATYLAYAWTLPFVPLLTCWLAIKEKSRFGMSVILVGAISVAVMTVRMMQIVSAG